MNDQRRETVLVVDDEMANLGVLFEFLNAANFRVMIAEDGAGALDAMASNAPDIALLDVNLPDMDGFELYARIKEHAGMADMPVIFVTVERGIEEKVRAFDMQAVDYIVKPFVPQEVVVRVQRHLLLRSLRRRLQAQNAQMEQEIGARVRAQTALAEKRAYLDSILRSADDRAIVTVDLELRVTYFNPLAEELYRLPAAMAIGKHIRDVCREEMPVDNVVRGLEGVRVQGEHRYIMTLDIDGSTHYIASRISNINNEEGELIGYARFSHDITARLQAEEELVRHRDHLEELVTARTRRVSELAAHLGKAEQAERQQLARELHDQVGQNLTAISLNLAALQKQIPQHLSGPHEVVAQVDARLIDSLAMVKETTQRVRGVMDNLRPPALEEYGLIAALRWYATQFSTRANIAVSVHGEEPSPRLAAATETALFRVVQEALTNVARHAQATAVRINLEEIEMGVCMCIVDDGVGFDPQSLAPDSERQPWGLLTMNERAQAVNGHCRVVSTPGEGTQIIVEVVR